MSISTKVLTLISRVAQKNISENQELLASGLIDSVGAMELVLAVQKEFAVEIPFECIADVLSNSSKLIQFVENNIKG